MLLLLPILTDDDDSNTVELAYLLYYNKRKCAHLLHLYSITWAMCYKMLWPADDEHP